MNRSFLILICLFWLSATVELSGQSDPYGDYLNPNVGDTIHGKVEYIDRRGASTEFYKKIRVTNAKGKRKKFKRGDVESFRVDGVRYEGFWLSQSSDKIVLLNPYYYMDRENGERYFLRIISLGRLSHYQLEWWEQDEAGINRMDLLITEGDVYFIRATQGIFGLKRKALSKYFKYCHELA
ncbi:MAG: hypothetical protein WBG42_02720, partial [Cryomorphaceae bacterium]